jgi:hypothetical protein
VLKGRGASREKGPFASHEMPRSESHFTCGVHKFPNACITMVAMASSAPFDTKDVKQTPGSKILITDSRGV